MNVGYLVLGAVLLTVAVVDILWTTLWVAGGAGPLTSRLMVWTWRLLRTIGGRNSRLLSLSGPLIFVLGLGAWIVLLWAGWTFIFASAEAVLTDSLNRGAASWSDLIYFTGYTIFTLGIGDLVPQEGVWQLGTILATASGLLFITLTVTYVLSVLDAVTQKRAFAQNVSGLGAHAAEVIRTSWTGEEFRGLELSLNSLVTELNTLTANHKAYPILHYFHSAQSDQAPVVEIAVLDDALTILEFGVSGQHRPDDLILQNARSSVQSYLALLRSSYVDPSDGDPPEPDLGALRDAGVPVVSDEEFASALEELRERRRTLLGLVESDTRQWPQPEDD